MSALCAERFFNMQFTVALPDKLGLGIGTDVQHLFQGVTNGWMSLPVDAQKTVKEVRIAYHGSTTLPLPSDVFDIEVKIELRVDGESVLRTASLRINDFRGDLSKKVSNELRAAVKREIEALGQEYEPAARLLL
jgi:hypothetical protein